MSVIVIFNVVRHCGGTAWDRATLCCWSAPRYALFQQEMTSIECSARTICHA